MKIVDRIFKCLNELNDKGELRFPLEKGTVAYEKIEKICDRELRSAFDNGGVAAVRVLNKARIDPFLYEGWKKLYQDKEG